LHLNFAKIWVKDAAIWQMKDEEDVMRRGRRN
jgi:hypothetical protein